ncbi:hypothetical protein NRB_37510 [Novosphingobium sp. 11B]|uniref:DUF6468 domain-containing protein n=1 Tax=Novosphingobium resinovorum TaxID=158500 RepID=A0A1D8A5N9_9SPHN|nr:MULTISPECIES: DUF6468 domain-containing protein [Sphingomonadaceae]AOR77447.1 hypothetical protein BES08_12305 [Novosphingobium resinovorum]EJU12180.1 hypothetical protein LH128_15126 [Sphingomonas sp. LH128]
MTLATGINLALVLMCLVVMVQAIRMDRRIRALRDGHLDQAVEKLDNATHQARLVLAELKRVLSTDAAAQGEILQASRELRDELSVMVGVGNSVAERIVDAADKARAAEAGVRRRTARWRDEADAVLRAEAETRPAAPAPAPVADEARELSRIVFDLTSKRGNRVA